MNILVKGFQKLEHYRQTHRQMWPKHDHATFTGAKNVIFLGHGDVYSKPCYSHMVYKVYVVYKEIM